MGPLRGFVESTGSPANRVTSFRAAAENDLVAVHSRFASGSSDEPDSAVVDIFRFEDGRIVEHWDVIQPAATESVSGHTMFDGGAMNIEGATGDDTSSQEMVAAVRALYDRAFNNGELDSLVALVVEDYVQHNPQISDGRDGLRQALMFFRTMWPELEIRPVRFIAEGDLVYAHVHITVDADDRGDVQAGSAGIDIFRFENGMIAEHWDVLQEIPEEAANTNTMF